MCCTPLTICAEESSTRLRSAPTGQKATQAIASHNHLTMSCGVPRTAAKRRSERPQAPPRPSQESQQSSRCTPHGGPAGQSAARAAFTKRAQPRALLRPGRPVHIALLPSQSRADTGQGHAAFSQAGMLCATVPTLAASGPQAEPPAALPAAPWPGAGTPLQHLAQCTQGHPRSRQARPGRPAPGACHSPMPHASYARLICAQARSRHAPTALQAGAPVVTPGAPRMPGRPARGACPRPCRTPRTRGRAARTARPRAARPRPGGAAAASGTGGAPPGSSARLRRMCVRL